MNLLSFALSFIIYSFLNSPTFAQFTGCDYAQTMNIGQTYYVFSPGYGQNRNYSPGTNCRWNAQAPAGYRINVYCYNIQLPQDINGNLDRIIISYSGNPNLTDGQVYTTNQTFAYSSSGNRVVIALRSSVYSRGGGKFICSLITAGAGYPNVPGTIPPTTPGYCDCGRRRDVTSSTNQQFDEYPMAAGLSITPYTQIFCGATIISTNYALTAAHCVLNQNVQTLGLIVGVHGFLPGVNSVYSSVLPLSNIITNPNYNSRNYDSDIAIVQTQNPINFNIAVGPACLPFKYAQQSKNFANTAATSDSWVTTAINGFTYSSLQKNSLNVVPNGQCQIYFPVTANQICSYAPYNKTCQMNAGGPLLHTKSNVVFLIGVTSFGQGCSKFYPGAGARVTQFLNWIVQNTPGAQYCYK